MIIHKEDSKCKGYYLCNHAIGFGNPKKMAKKWSQVTCKNCLKRNSKYLCNIGIRKFKCPWCGKEEYTKVYNKRFCCYKCTRAYHNEKHNAKTRQYTLKK